MLKETKINWAGRVIKGIVFDIDGTLTDSIENYWEVFREATSRVGIVIKKEDVLEPMVTGSFIWDRAIPRDIVDRDNKIKECMRLIPGVFNEVMRKTRIFNDVPEVLRAAKKANLKLGAFTASWNTALRPLTDNKLMDLFDGIVTSESGNAPKPAPDGIYNCLKQMEVSPQHSIMVGDSPLDIKAGNAAGTLTIGVLTGIGSKSQIQNANPTAIADQLRSIIALLAL